MHIDPVQEARLREHLALDETTGDFFWIKQRGRVGAAGRAGCNKNSSTRVIGFFGKYYNARSLAIWWTTGSWPERTKRPRVRPPYKPKPKKVRGKIPYYGVTCIRSGSKGLRYVAQYNKGGIKKYLGCHKSAEDASRQYEAFCKLVESGEYLPSVRTYPETNTSGEKEIFATIHLEQPIK